jgi:hypothetical protein
MTSSEATTRDLVQSSATYENRYMTFRPASFAVTDYASYSVETVHDELWIERKQAWSIARQYNSIRL